MHPVGSSQVIPDQLAATLMAPLDSFRAAALAVSGGPDSMALMYLARRWCGLAGRDPASILAVTVDHGLRPGSAGEAAFVAIASEKLGFAHTTLTWDGEKPASALQARARTARYGLMTALCRDRDIGCLVTAHTRDDRAETFVMRLKRGSGVDGLAAIAPASAREGVTLLRPLLTVSKSRLTTYLRALDIPFVTDPSNENVAFERVRVRHTLRTMQNAGVTPLTLSRTAMRLNRARDALSFATGETMQAALHVFPLGDGELDRDILQRVPDEIALRVLGETIAALGGGKGPPELAKLERLFARSAGTGFEATLGGCKLQGSLSKISMVRELGRISKGEFVLAPGEVRLWDGRFEVRLCVEAGAPVSIAALGPRGLTQCKRLGIAWPGERSVQWRTAALSTPAVWLASKPIEAPMAAGGATAASSAVQVQARLCEGLGRFLKHTKTPPATELGK